MRVKGIFRTGFFVALQVSAMSVFMTSCNGRGESVEIHRLDREISVGIMPEDSLSIKATETLFELSGYPYATPLTVADYSEKPSIREHIEGVEKEFPDTEREAVALGQLFRNMRRELPQVRIPNVFTIISPFTQSIFVADTTLYIGLNHYLGSDNEHYGYFPDYIRKLKERRRIPVDVAEALVRVTYPYSPEGAYPNSLTRMAYEGAVAEAVVQMSGADESYVLGYDDVTYDMLRGNEAELWKMIVERKLLFSTDNAVIRSLVDSAPHVSVLSPDVPGRAGRFVGHRIVKAYLNSHPSATLPELLSAKFYESPSLLTDAGYNPL